jgi:hypothetical protein
MTIWRLTEPIDDDISDAAGTDPQNRRLRSRRRAWRNGLAAQTIIENIEDNRSYRSFERAIAASFGPRSVIELELIHRLASPAVAITPSQRGRNWFVSNPDQASTYPTVKGFPSASSESAMRQIPLQFSGSEQIPPSPDGRRDPRSQSTRTLSPFLRRSLAGASSSGTMAQCFLGLFNLDASLLERAGAYEARLWRQAAQTIWTLDAMRRLPTALARSRFRKPVARYFWDRDRYVKAS